jgi:hypothetical protein
MAADRCVYFHRRNDTGAVFYVGKGQRARPKSRTGRTLYWQRIVAKAGYSIQIVRAGMTDEQAYALEARLIGLYRSRGRTLVNVCDGGAGVPGFQHTEDTKAIMAAKKLGVKRGPHSVEWNQKIAGANKGNRNFLGHTHSAETKRKMRVAKLDKPRIDSRQVRCIESGKVFTSLSAAAHSCGANVGNLAKHLNRKPSHKSVCGRTWEWLTL